MTSFNTVAMSSAVTTNPPRPRSFQSSIPHPSPSIAGPHLATCFYPSPPLLPSSASSHIYNGASRRRSSGFLGSGLNSTNLWISAAMKPDSLKIMISGAPASGKGTQCELITKKLFEKDCGPPEKQIAPSFNIVHGAEKNVKQLRMELPARDQPLHASKISYAEPRRNFIGERAEDGRKTFLPESANIAAQSETRKNEPKRLISGASVAEWTDEQLDMLFSKYDDDF